VALRYGGGAFAFWRTQRQSAVATSLCLIWFFNFGHLQRGLELATGAGLGTAATGVLLLGTAGVGILVGRMFLVPASRARRIEPALNAVALALLALPVAIIAADSVSEPYAPAVREDLMDEVAVVDPAGATPDIYYIVLDAYGASPVLQRIYDLDNRPFIEGLRERGFYVAESSHANYSQTGLSLASSLNYRYLDELTHTPGRDSQDRRVLTGLLTRPRLLRELERRRYTSYAFRTGYRLAHLRGVDHFLSADQAPSEFHETILALTPLPYLMALLQTQSRHDRYRAQVLFTLDRLGDLAARPGPKFVFAHVISPHPPFVFDADGEPTGNDRPLNFFDGSHYLATASQSDYIDRYRAQAAFIGDRVLRAIDEILSASTRDPVIVLQADHGPGAFLDQESLEGTDLDERLSILNAYRLPEGGDRALYPGITPVNSFRLILHHYFGVANELVGDRSHFSTDTRPFDFHDVTARLRAPEKGTPDATPPQ